MKCSLVLLPSALLAMFAACDSNDPASGGAFDAGGFDASLGDGSTHVEPTGDAAPMDGGADGPTEASSTHASTGALVFDGVDDVVLVTPADGGPSEGAFTAELWFKTTTALGTMFNVFGSGGGADRFLFTQAGKVCFYVYGPPVTVCSTHATFNDGAWHHAAGTVGSVGGLRVYVDGALEGSNAGTTKSTFTGGNRISIGLGPTAFNGSSVHFAGQLDEVRMWSVERGEAEIAASYRQILPGTTTGLQDYWSFDETGSAAVAHDGVTDAHDGTLSGFTFTTSPWVGPGAF